MFGIKKFHNYLYGRHFILLTDHRPLVSIFGYNKGIPQMAAGRLQRYAITLTGYDFDIEYIKSVDNKIADVLSRLPLRSNNNVLAKSGKASGSLLFMDDNFPVTQRMIKNNTVNNEILNKVMYYVMNGWSTNVESELKGFLCKKDQLHIDQGCLLWGYKVIIPFNLKEDILNELHSGHLGIVKMKSLARSYVWWPNIDADIEELTRKCKACISVRSSAPLTALTPWPWPTKPWYRIHADFLGPFENKVYLIIIDAHSKWLVK